MRALLIGVIGSLALASVAGCSTWEFYKVNIRQGNYIDQAMVSSLAPGMTRQQVMFIMGTPLLTDPFHQDRWDYYYSFSEGGKPVEQRHVKLYFQGDTLSRVEGSLNPVSP